MLWLIMQFIFLCFIFYLLFYMYCIFFSHAEQGPYYCGTSANKAFECDIVGISQK